MTKRNTFSDRPSLKSKLIGLVMIALGIAALAFDLFSGGRPPQSFGVALFCFLSVYGLAKLRNN